MSFWSKLFGKNKKVEVKEAVKVVEPVMEEPVVEEVVEEVTPEPEVAPEPKVAPKPKVNYNAMKVVELKELAKAKGITGYTKLKKAELIKALKK